MRLESSIIGCTILRLALINLKKTRNKCCTIVTLPVFAMHTNPIISQIDLFEVKRGSLV